MRILFVYHSMMVAFDAYIRSVTRPLAARGHDVHVLRCTLDGRASDEFCEGVWVHRRRQTVRLRGARRLSRIGIAKGMMRLLGGPERPALGSPFLRLSVPFSNYLAYRRLGIDVDVIETPEHLAEGLIFAILREKPLVVQIHGPLGVVAPHMGYRLGPHLRLATHLERLAVKRATATVVPSQVALRELARDGWVGTEQATVVPHVIDSDFWSGIPSAHDTGPVILAVGEVGRLKGSDMLIRAAGKVAKHVPGTRVVFVGPSSNGPNGILGRKTLAELAAKVGVACQFTGFLPREELVRWYAAARVVAIPSRFDTFSQVGLEAMASGRAVVCSTQTGLSELAGGANGAMTVVPVGDVDALAQALEPLLEDASLAESRGTLAKRFVERHSRPDLAAERREAVYTAAMERWNSAARTRR